MERETILIFCIIATTIVSAVKAHNEEAINYNVQDKEKRREYIKQCCGYKNCSSNKTHFFEKRMNYSSSLQEIVPMQFVKIKRINKKKRTKIPALRSKTTKNKEKQTTLKFFLKLTTIKSKPKTKLKNESIKATTKQKNYQTTRVPLKTSKNIKNKKVESNNKKSTQTFLEKKSTSLAEKQKRSTVTKYYIYMPAPTKANKYDYNPPGKSKRLGHILDYTKMTTEKHKKKYSSVRRKSRKPNYQLTTKILDSLNQKPLLHKETQFMFTKFSTKNIDESSIFFHTSHDQTTINMNMEYLEYLHTLTSTYYFNPTESSLVNDFYTVTESQDTSSAIFESSEFKIFPETSTTWKFVDITQPSYSDLETNKYSSMFHYSQSESIYTTLPKFSYPEFSTSMSKFSFVGEIENEEDEIDSLTFEYLISSPHNNFATEMTLFDPAMTNIQFDAWRTTNIWSDMKVTQRTEITEVDVMTSIQNSLWSTFLTSIFDVNDFNHDANEDIDDEEDDFEYEQFVKSTNSPESSKIIYSLTMPTTDILFVEVSSKMATYTSIDVISKLTSKLQSVTQTLQLTSLTEKVKTTLLYLSPRTDLITGTIFSAEITKLETSNLELTTKTVYRFNTTAILETTNLITTSLSKTSGIFKYNVTDNILISLLSSKPTLSIFEISQVTPSIISNNIFSDITKVSVISTKTILETDFDDEQDDTEDEDEEQLTTKTVQSFTVSTIAFNNFKDPSFPSTMFTIVHKDTETQNLAASLFTTILYSTIATNLFVETTRPYFTSTEIFNSDLQDEEDDTEDEEDEVENPSTKTILVTTSTLKTSFISTIILPTTLLKSTSPKKEINNEVDQIEGEREEIEATKYAGSIASSTKITEISKIPFHITSLTSTDVDDEEDDIENDEDEEDKFITKTMSFTLTTYSTETVSLPTTNSLKTTKINTEIIVEEEEEEQEESSKPAIPITISTKIITTSYFVSHSTSSVSPNEDDEDDDIQSDEEEKIATKTILSTKSTLNPSVYTTRAVSLPTSTFQATTINKENNNEEEEEEDEELSNLSVSITMSTKIPSTSQFVSKITTSVSPNVDDEEDDIENEEDENEKLTIKTNLYSTLTLKPSVDAITTVPLPTNSLKTTTINKETNNEEEEEEEISKIAVSITMPTKIPVTSQIVSKITSAVSLDVDDEEDDIENEEDEEEKITTKSNVFTIFPFKPSVDAVQLPATSLKTTTINKETNNEEEEEEELSNVRVSITISTKITSPSQFVSKFTSSVSLDIDDEEDDIENEEDQENIIQTQTILFSTSSLKSSVDITKNMALSTIFITTTVNEENNNEEEEEQEVLTMKPAVTITSSTKIFETSQFVSKITLSLNTKKNDKEDDAKNGEDEDIKTVFLSTVTLIPTVDYRQTAPLTSTSLKITEEDKEEQETTTKDTFSVTTSSKISETSKQLSSLTITFKSDIDDEEDDIETSTLINIETTKTVQIATHSIKLNNDNNEKANVSLTTTTTVNNISTLTTTSNESVKTNTVLEQEFLTVKYNSESILTNTKSNIAIFLSSSSTSPLIDRNEEDDEESDEIFDDNSISKSSSTTRKYFGNATVTYIVDIKYEKDQHKELNATQNTEVSTTANNDLISINSSKHVEFTKSTLVVSSTTDPDEADDIENEEEKDITTISISTSTPTAGTVFTTNVSPVISTLNIKTNVSDMNVDSAAKYEKHIKTEPPLLSTYNFTLAVDTFKTDTKTATKADLDDEEDDNENEKDEGIYFTLSESISTKFLRETSVTEKTKQHDKMNNTVTSLTLPFTTTQISALVQLITATANIVTNDELKDVNNKESTVDQFSFPTISSLILSTSKVNKSFELDIDTKKLDPDEVRHETSTKLTLSTVITFKTIDTTRVTPNSNKPGTDNKTAEHEDENSTSSILTLIKSTNISDITMASLISDKVDPVDKFNIEKLTSISLTSLANTSKIVDTTKLANANSTKSDSGNEDDNTSKSVTTSALTTELVNTSKMTGTSRKRDPDDKKIDTEEGKKDNPDDDSEATTKSVTTLAMTTKVMDTTKIISDSVNPDPDVENNDTDVDDKDDSDDDEKTTTNSVTTLVLTTLVISTTKITTINAKSDADDDNDDTDEDEKDDPDDETETTTKAVATLAIPTKVIDTTKITLASAKHDTDEEKTNTDEDEKDDPDEEEETTTKSATTLAITIKQIDASEINSASAKPDTNDEKDDTDEDEKDDPDDEEEVTTKSATTLAITTKQIDATKITSASAKPDTNDEKGDTHDDEKDDPEDEPETTSKLISTLLITTKQIDASKITTINGKPEVDDEKIDSREDEKDDLEEDEEEGTSTKSLQSSLIMTPRLVDTTKTSITTASDTDDEKDNINEEEDTSKSVSVLTTTTKKLGNMGSTSTEKTDIEDETTTMDDEDVETSNSVSEIGGSKKDDEDGDTTKAVPTTKIVITTKEFLGSTRQITESENKEEDEETESGEEETKSTNVTNLIMITTKVISSATTSNTGEEENNDSEDESTSKQETTSTQNKETTKDFESIDKEDKFTEKDEEQEKDAAETVSTKDDETTVETTELTKDDEVKVEEETTESDE